MSRISPSETIRHHATEVIRLRRARDDLQLALERHLAALRVAIPPGAACDLGDAVIHVVRPAWRCTVRRPDEVPLAFVMPAPDRSRILEHYRRTGEVLPGVSYMLASSAVVIRPRSEAPGRPP